MKRDVAIIGGSTAGFFAGYLLAKEGLDVRIFEAEERIDPEPRTLIVTNSVTDLLGSEYEKIVINKIHRFEIFADGKAATIPLSQPDLVIDRNKLVKELSIQAERQGARVLMNKRFLDLNANQKRINFKVSHNGDQNAVEESAQVLLGGDGVFSKVAQSAGWLAQPTVELSQAVVDLPKDMSPDVTRVWFIPQETTYFYWLIPHSPTQGVLGLIGDDGRNTEEILLGFMERKGLTPIELQSATVPRYTRWVSNHRQIGDSHIYLVGDAAGHVKVSTVGGIVTGFRGAIGVVEAILNGGPGNELRAVKKELDRHCLIRKVLDPFTTNDYVSLINFLNPGTRRSLGQISRDESFRLIKNLILRQPRLLLMGLRSLITRR